jgi:hypothetical protein
MMTDRFGTEQNAVARQAELALNVMVESAMQQGKAPRTREPLPRFKVRARLVGVAVAGMLLVGFLTFGGGLGDAAGAAQGGGGDRYGRPRDVLLTVSALPRRCSFRFPSCSPSCG